MAKRRFCSHLGKTLLVLSLSLAGQLGMADDASVEPLLLHECRISAGPGAPSLKARCATMTRPLDPSGAASGDIELRVAVVPALNLTPEADPVVPIAGGPGQGTVQFYAAYAQAFEPLRRNRDILLVDQRGTGESARLDCDVDDGLTEGQFSDAETIEFTKVCIEALPHDPRFFTTSVAVQDLEAVRLALGYPALNLYGISYGSRVAQHFARRYPDATRTVIIDGVVPPQIALGPEIAIESQRAMDTIFARCVEDRDCRDAFGDVDNTFDRVLRQLREAPVNVSVPAPDTGRLESITFGATEFGAAIRLLAYHPSTIALLPLLIDEAGKGNFNPITAQYLSTVSSLGEQLALGMHNAVACTEDAPFFQTQNVDDAALARTYMGPLLVDAMSTICSVWPRGVLDDDLQTPLGGDVPVLLLSGDADPITPPRYAELAAADLGNSRHLIGAHQGHGQITVGCMPRVAEQFVATRDVEGLDTDCLAHSFVMPFFVDFSGPKP